MRGLQLRAAMALVVIALAACGASRPAPTPRAGVATTSTSPPDSAAPSTAASTATTALSRATPPGTGTGTVPVPAAAPTSTSTAPRPTTTATSPPQPDPLLAQVGAAGQAIVVMAPSLGATTATLDAYERVADGWRRAFGPWTARVGARGIAPPGAKREGDGRTPSGVYGFDFMFGVAAEPGVRFPYRRVTSRSIVWDDDPASPLYNTWVDLDRQDAGAAPEPMYVSPAYDYGAVIAYNAARTPGLGSAIFLHVSTGAATAGCVSLPAGQLLDILRWLDPARGPRIVLAVAD